MSVGKWPEREGGREGGREGVPNKRTCSKRSFGAFWANALLVSLKHQKKEGVREGGREGRREGTYLLKESGQIFRCLLSDALHVALEDEEVPGLDQDADRPQNVLVCL